MRRTARRSTYSYTMGRVEVRLLRNDANLLVAISIVLAAAGVFMLVRRFLLQYWMGFAFEVPDSNAMFEGFGLSEQLAAERARGRMARRA
jgi:hypothetical protein